MRTKNGVQPEQTEHEKELKRRLQHWRARVGFLLIDFQELSAKEIRVRAQNLANEKREIEAMGCAHRDGRQILIPISKRCHPHEQGE